MINQNVHQWLIMDHTRGAGNGITVITERSMGTYFDGLRTKLLLKTLRLFDTSFQKNLKSHVFLKSEKHVKYVFSNTAQVLLVVFWAH